MDNETMKKIKAYLAQRVVEGRMSQEAADERLNNFLRAKGRGARAFREFSVHIKEHPRLWGEEAKRS